MMNRFVLGAIFVVQILAAGFFFWRTFSALIGGTPISWQFQEMIEIGAAVSLIIGAVLGGVMLRRVLLRSRRVEEQLRAASGAFMELLDEKFEHWGLTAAERDVALFAVKGMSVSEIATLRATSEGTVKAQTNAIYRKAGVSGRPQLLSLFIEDLMDGPVTPRDVAGR